MRFSQPSFHLAVTLATVAAFSVLCAAAPMGNEGDDESRNHRFIGELGAGSSGTGAETDNKITLTSGHRRPTVLEKPKPTSLDCMQLKCNKATLFAHQTGCWNKNLEQLVQQHGNTGVNVTIAGTKTPAGCPAYYGATEFTGVRRSYFGGCPEHTCWIAPAKKEWALELQGCTKIRNVPCLPLLLP